MYAYMLLPDTAAVAVFSIPIVVRASPCAIALFCIPVSSEIVLQKQLLWNSFICKTVL
jgi:hypothetical protein